MEYDKNTIIPSDSLVAEAIKGLKEKDKELVIRTIATLRTKLHEMLLKCENLDKENRALYKMAINETRYMLMRKKLDDEDECKYLYKEILEHYEK